MRTKAPNEYRVRRGALASEDSLGMTGAFMIPKVYKSGSKVILAVISSDGTGEGADGWEHVSVRVANLDRLPTWDEMKMIKEIFWSEEEAVFQLHPPDIEYSNVVEALHLWRHRERTFELPPVRLVGPITGNTNKAAYTKFGYQISGK